MRFLLSLALLLALAAPVMADYKGPGAQAATGGYKGPVATQIDTVAKALEASDDTHVVLTGNIINKLSRDEYTFKDATGQIQVEISNKKFNGVDVTPETPVRLYGKVDRDFGKTLEVDVKHLEVVK